MQDILAVTSHLREKGVETPTVVRTVDGGLFAREHDDVWWRALTYVPGRFVSHLSDPRMANSAGAFVARFHNALADLQHKFQFSLAHFHDTAYHIKRASTVVHAAPEARRDLFLRDIEFIENEYASLHEALDGLPKRIIHGDLKISNVIFADDGSDVCALIDLDTLMHHSIAVELGDALRSWCATGDEDTAGLAFDPALYQAAYDAYAREAHFASIEELEAIPRGIAVITLELAARFIADACEESYFTLDSSRYTSLFEQNKNRAMNQLSLCRSLREKLGDLI